MLSEIAIEIKGLGKCYRIYDQPHHRLLQMLNPRGHRYYREFWALKDISFQIKKGETVGIIGKNGSGKSTLLQLICGTLNSTVGTIKCNGRVAALLELGSGFNPDFTGRENVYLNASILGLGKSEIDLAFDAIVRFADIGNFLDQPVKVYSSGMLVRLAFAVAVHSNPDILVVDEALAVGDELFQRKCFSRIEAIKKNGGTILFVSHAAASIVELCDRAILLDEGELLALGGPQEVVGAYHKFLYSSRQAQIDYRQKIINGVFGFDSEIAHNQKNSTSKESDGDNYLTLESYSSELVSESVISYESRGAHIDEPKIFTLDGCRVNSLVGGREYKYTYEVSFWRDVFNVRFAMMLKTVSGYELGGSVTNSKFGERIPFVSKGAKLLVEFHFKFSLRPGTYFLNAGVLALDGEDEVYLHRLVDAIAFKVQPTEESRATGMVDFNISSSVKYIEY